MKKYISLYIFCCLFSTITAQPDNLGNATSAAKHPLSIHTKNYGDSVVLVWQAASPSLWMQYHDQGYTIERLELGSNQSAKRLTQQPVFPWTLEQIKKQFDPKDNPTLMAAQALYGAMSDPTDPSVSKGIFGQGDIEKDKYFLATLALVGSQKAATILGQRFVDKDFQKGKNYLYRVISGTDTAQTIVFTDQITVLKPIEFTAKAGDSTVKLSFNADFFQSIYPFYRVERSADDGKTWLNRTPNNVLTNKSPNQEGEWSPMVIFNDSLPRNYKTYLYRLVGFDNFADAQVSTNVEAVMGRDLTGVSAPWLENVEVTADSRLRLSWKKPVVEPDFKGFKIIRSTTLDGIFKPISDLLPPSSDNFIDDKPFPMGTNFYKVVALDTAGNETESFPYGAELVDTIPPSVPTGLTGSIDTFGIVRLAWQPSPESDVRGYKVYSSNFPDDEFFDLNGEPLTTPQYQDSISLNVLNTAIYYRVVALDQKFNHSQKSAVLRLIKPVKIPPSEPVLADYEVKNGKVYLKWANSISESLVETRVLRSEDRQNWTIIKTFPVKEGTKRSAYDSFEDTKPYLGKSTYYAIEAVNAGGLTAKCPPLLVEVQDETPKPTLQNPQANRVDEGVQLSWEYAQKIGYFVRIYRSTNGKDYEQLRDVRPTPPQYIDRLGDKKGTFRYMFKAIFEDGNESLLSSEVKIVVGNSN